MDIKNIEGAKEESEFWNGIITDHKNNPKAWINSFLERSVPAPDYLRKFINKNMCSAKAEILDLGCGPFGGIQANGISDIDVGLHYLDPLAAEYNDLLIKHGLNPVQITEGVAENLGQIYREGFFDFVNADNSLDHCQDPRLAIENIIKVLKPGGVCRIKVFVDEGLYTGYSGFHQWNFSSLSEKIIIWRDSEVYYIDESTGKSPYTFHKSTEITGVGDTRETLVIYIQKYEDKPLENIYVKDYAVLRSFPLVSAVTVSPGKRFNNKQNLFIHSGKRSEFVAKSRSALFGTVPYTLRYEEGSEFIRIGQYENHDGLFTNTWTHEIDF